MATLLEMPSEILEQIVDFVGCPGIFILRNVCHDLRNFVDDINPYFKLDRMSIELLPEHMRIFCGQSGEIYSFNYDKSDEETFFKMLATILKSQKSTLAIFAMNEISPLPGVFDKINEILKSRRSPLKVHELWLDIAHQYEIHSILSNLEPGTLERIWLKGSDSETLRLKEIVKLEQWKRAKELNILRFTVSAPLTGFGHFERVSASFRLVDWVDLDILRETFLSNPETKRLFDIYYWGLNGWDEWRESLGPAINENDGEPEWHFKYPKSDRTLRVADFYDRIVFETLD